MKNAPFLAGRSFACGFGSNARLMMLANAVEVDAPIDAAAACSTLRPGQRQRQRHATQPRIPLENLRHVCIETDNASSPYQREFYGVEALAAREAQCTDLAEPAPPSAARTLAFGNELPPPPPPGLSPGPGRRSCCLSNTGSLVTAVRAKRAMHLRFPPRAERSLQRIALGAMPAMIKEDHHSAGDDHLSVCAHLSAPDADVAAMSLLRRSSTCAPPASPALETVDEESTAPTELYRTWYLGSVRKQSCDTEGKVHGGMAFGLQSKVTRVPDAPRCVRSSLHQCPVSC